MSVCGGGAEWADGEQKEKYNNEQVYCSNCYAVTAPDHGKEAAAAWWNRRAGQPQTVGLVETIERDLAALNGEQERKMQPKIEEVYRCSECDEAFADQSVAAHHCVELPPKEYKCLQCGFVWGTMDEAIRCYDHEAAYARGE